MSTSIQHGKGNKREGTQAGQTQAFDMMIGVLIFLLAFGVVLQTWNGRLSDLQQEREDHSLLFTARQLSDQLLQSRGTDANWEISGKVRRIGLASEPWIISPAKTQALASGLSAPGSLDYNETLDALGLNGEDFFIRILVNGSTVLEAGNVAGSADRQVAVERGIDYNGMPARMVVGLLE